MSLARAAALLSLAACSATPVPPQDAGSDGGPRPWNPNEVSILFPPPLELAMRGTRSDGGASELMPADVFARLGNRDAGLPRLVEAFADRDLYPDLRVVSARVDPCFDGPDDAGVCERQVRLAAQVVEPGGSISDAAIHLFYRLNEAEFIEVLARLRALSRAQPVSGVLGVHPAPAGIAAVIRDACSTANLTRFTFMAVGRSKNWFFHILDRRSDGSFVESEIVGAGSSDAFTDQGQPGFRMGIMPPVPWFPAALLTTGETRALSQPAFESAYDALVRLANPKLTRTADVSCAACHAGPSTQVESLRDRDAGTAPMTASAYASPPLQPSTPPFRIGNMHAFSYFFGQPTVSERTLNETQEVVRYLSSEEFLKTLSPADRARLE